MGEPKPMREARRPEHIPLDWRTRQQAQADLKLRSPYALKKLLDALQPTEADFQMVGQVGYLSPQLVERMRLELAAVEDIRDLPGYRSGMAAQTEIGCSFKKFTDLVTEHPPSVQLREVVKARNHNSEVNPVYSPDYVDSLKRYYEPRAISEHPRPAHPSDAVARPRPSSALVGKILDRIERTPESRLVDPARAERDQLAARVSVVIDQLDRIPHRDGDACLSQLWRQLNQALSELKGDQPMPQGVERLLEQASRYMHSKED